MSDHQLVALSKCVRRGDCGAAQPCPEGCGARIQPVTLHGLDGWVEWKGRLHEWSLAIWHDAARCATLRGEG